MAATLTCTFQKTVGAGDEERDVTLTVEFKFIRGRARTWSSPGDADEADIQEVIVTEPDGVTRKATKAEIAEWFDYRTVPGARSYEMLLDVGRDSRLPGGER